MTIQGWLAAVREMPEEGAELGQNWADAQDVPGVVPPPTREFGARVPRSALVMKSASGDRVEKSFGTKEAHG